MRKNTYTSFVTLREFRGATIAVECVTCDRRDTLDRQTLVKRYGADLSFAALRRRLAMGCSKMQADDGIDRCETRFPDLVAAGLSLAKEDQHDRQ
jgi:hypothetical protein